MKVLFDLRSLASPRTGIGFYTQHLLEQLLVDPDVNALCGFLDGAILDADAISVLIREDQPDLGSRPTLADENQVRRPALLPSVLRRFVRKVPGAYAIRQVYREHRSASRVAALAAQGYVYHEPNYIPISYPGKIVVTVHDLSSWRYPQFHPPERVAYLNQRLPAAIERADEVITDSQFVKQEIIDVFGVKPEKISAIHLGADPQFRPRAEVDIRFTLSKFGLRYQGFVLSVATLEPRKNLERLIRAYAKLPDLTRNTYPLVLVGASGWMNSDLMSSARALKDRGNVIVTGYISRAELIDLYAGAAVFAYPSLYEGFGLPVLEAFACGAPVLTSNTSSLAEVSGGAALEVDPSSLEDILDGLQRLLESDSVRAHHTALGRERAANFSWTRCAKETVAVYRGLV